MNIDLSKKPEGATHYTTEKDGRLRDWFKINRAGTWEHWYRDQWVITEPVDGIPSGNLFSALHGIDIEPNPHNWAGEGLPPVGTVCEWHPSVHGWVTVTILGRDGNCTWYRVKGEEASETCRHMTFFRPIRTPEQIAADERLHKIKNACTDIAAKVEPWNEDIDCSHAMRAVIEAMIDAGYRK